MNKRILFFGIILFLSIGLYLPSILQAATTIKSPANSGLNTWLTFDEGTSTIAHDFSGNGRNGTLVSSPIWSGGKRGKSLLFNGSSDYVDLGNIQGGIVDFSWFAWIKTTQNISDGNYYQAPVVIGTVQGSGDTNDANLVVNGGRLGWYDELATGVAYDTGRVVNDGVWHHVGAVRAGTTVAFYVDGVPAGSVSTGTDGLNSNGIQVAKANWSLNRFFGGNIDDVRIYNRAISVAEALALYRSNEVTRRTVTDNGLVAQWSFDEGTSTTARDYPSNSYNGALVNSPVWTNGKGGQAVQFNGSTNYVIANNPVNFNQSYSVSFWVYFNSIAAYGLFSNSPIAPPVTGASGNSNDIYLNPNGTIGYFIFDGVGKNLTSTTTLSAGRWYHVSVTHDTANSVRRLYIDGRLEHQDNNLNIQSFSKVIFSFSRSDGGYYTTPLGLINGKMDEVRIYNRALSPSEVAVLADTVSTTVNGSQNTALTSGLVGLWSFNGVDMNWTSGSAGFAYDRSGTNSTGVLTNMSQISTPAAGKVGQSLLLDGVNDYVIAPRPGTLTGMLSICLWAKWTTLTGGIGNIQALVDNNHSGAGIGFIIQDRPDLAQHLTFSVNPATSGVQSTTIVGNGTWRHICATNDGATSRLYIDGVLDASAAEVPDGAYQTSITLGMWQGGGRYFKGNLDDVRIYNRAIAATEVKRLYLMGK